MSYRKSHDCGSRSDHRALWHRFRREQMTQHQTNSSQTAIDRDVGKLSKDGAQGFGISK